MEKDIQDMVDYLTKQINYIRKEHDEYDEYENGQLSVMVNMRDRLAFILNKNNKQ